MLCPQPEGAPFTFSGEKVPAGRMRVFYLTHQSRCARQLSLRHANSPRGKLKMLCPQPEGAPFTFPVGEGARRAKKCLLPSPGRRCPQGEGVPFTFSREKVPAGRMRIFYLTHQSRSARQLSLRHASSPRGSWKQFARNPKERLLPSPRGKVPAGRMGAFYLPRGGRCPQGGWGSFITLISLAALVSLAFGTQATPRGSWKGSARNPKERLLPSPWGKVPAGRMRVFYSQVLSDRRAQPDLQ